MSELSSDLNDYFSNRIDNVVNNLIVTEVRTQTTDGSSGIFVSDISSSGKYLLSIQSRGTIVIPFLSSSGYYGVKAITANGDKILNTSITVRFIYCLDRTAS